MKNFSIREALELYLVTDSTWLDGRPLYKVVEDAIKQGVTCVQLREKDLSPEDLYREAIIIKELCGIYRVPFIINDNLEVALRCDADGLHIGQEDGSLVEIRKQWKDKILGVSVQNLDQAKEAEAIGADYLGVGAIFQTNTKDDAIKVDLGTLSDICHNVSLPVVAIGGIQSENLLEFDSTGISGVAVVSAILAAKDIGKASRDLKELTKKVVG